ncbi:MAG: LPS export ABC transporter periplasmic protein LptC [Magnetococcales bacterium]|nr:LPS export ABC transporter periplasmic protein LptC [Magnetococcales bacterium]
MNRSRPGEHLEARRGRGLRRHVKHVFLILSLLIVGSVYWYLKRPYGLQTGNTQALDLLAGQQGALVTDIHLTQFDEQRIRWTLDAPSAQRGEGKQILIHHPRLGFSRNEQENIVVTAQEGDVDGGTGKMVLTGRVEAGDAEMGRLLTEQLRFDPEKRMLYTDQAFRLEREQMRLEGQGLTLLQEAQTLTVDSHVRMTFPEALLTTEQP